MQDVGSGRDETRSRLIDVAAGLLSEHGPAAVTTRAVAARAGVQAPTIYRIFGDKDGLLDAVAEQVFTAYVSTKLAADDAGDPVDDLRAAWDTHIAFGLANPSLYALLNDPERAAHSPAGEAGLAVLRARVRRVARAGRLRVAEEQAVEMIHAAGTGAVLAMLSMPEERRRPGLADEMYDALAAAILTGAPPPGDGGPVAAVVAFRAVVPELRGLSEAERALLRDWLDRAVEA